MKQATARAPANWLRVYAMPVVSVYSSYIPKAEKKGRTRAEVRSTRPSVGSPATAANDSPHLSIRMVGARPVRSRCPAEPWRRPKPSHW